MSGSQTLLSDIGAESSRYTAGPTGLESRLSESNVGATLDTTSLAPKDWGGDFCQFLFNSNGEVVPVAFPQSRIVDGDNRLRVLHFTAFLTLQTTIIQSNAV